MARFSMTESIHALPFLNAILEASTSYSVLIWTTPTARKIFECARDRGLKKHAQRIKIVSYQPDASEVFAILEHAKRAAEEFPPERLYSLDQSFQTAFLSWWSSSPQRISFTSSRGAFLFTDLRPKNTGREVALAEEFLDLLPEELRSKLPSLQRMPSVLSADSAGRKFSGRVILCLDAERPTQVWPAENALALVRAWVQDGKEVMLIGEGGENGETEIERLLALFRSPLVKKISSELDFSAKIDFLESAELLVSADGPWLAAASDLGLPSLGIFGPTLPEFGRSPWRRPSRVLGVANLPCRPCGYHAPKRCPKKHHKCLKDIGGERVFSEAKTLLAGVLDPAKKSL